MRVSVLASPGQLHLNHQQIANITTNCANIKKKFFKMFVRYSWSVRYLDNLNIISKYFNILDERVRPCITWSTSLKSPKMVNITINQ